jgi:hypothetical protein
LQCLHTSASARRMFSRARRKALLARFKASPPSPGMRVRPCP